MSNNIDDAIQENIHSFAQAVDADIQHPQIQATLKKLWRISESLIGSGY